MLKIRERIAARVDLVHSACVHPDVYWDRFGCEVCTECFETLRFNVCEPNPGCGSRG
jgi:hypothetical protein